MKTNALETAILETLAAGKPLVVETLRRTIGAASSADVGRQLGNWSKEGILFHCDRNGSRNGHTHIQFRDQRFAR